MATVAENLRAARKLIEQPEHWTKRAFARDEHGFAVGSLSDNAVCFCASGAITRVCDGDGNPLNAVRPALRIVVGKHITDWNDDPARTHAEVLAGFDKAIALAEQEGI